jgi:hypothetical protein
MRLLILTKTQARKLLTSFHIPAHSPGLPTLRALDISGLRTVDDATINLLTYGHQYVRWQTNRLASEKRAARHSYHVEESMREVDQLGLQYPLSELMYLRMKDCDGVTDKVAEYLSGEGAPTELLLKHMCIGKDSVERFRMHVWSWNTMCATDERFGVFV